MIVMSVIERVNPGVPAIVPREYTLYAIGIGMALLCGYGSDVLIRILGRDNR